MPSISNARPSATGSCIRAQPGTKAWAMHLWTMQWVSPPNMARRAPSSAFFSMWALKDLLVLLRVRWYTSGAVLFTRKTYSTFKKCTWTGINEFIPPVPVGTCPLWSDYLSWMSPLVAFTCVKALKSTAGSSDNVDVEKVIVILSGSLLWFCKSENVTGSHCSLNKSSLHQSYRLSVHGGCWQRHFEKIKKWENRW